MSVGEDKAGKAAGADGVLNACGLDSAGGVGSSDTDGSADGALIAGSDIELPGEADDSAGGEAMLAGCDGAPILGMADVVAAGVVVVVVVAGGEAGEGSTRLLS